MSFLWSILLLALASPSLAQLGFEGLCPDVTLLTEFNFDDYLGLWFGHSRYTYAPSENRACTYSYYEKQENNNNNITVITGSIRLDTGMPSMTPGFGVITGPGQLALTNANRNVNATNYFVLGTDYISYSVVYDCIQVNSTFHQKTAFILGRTRHMSEEAVATAEEIMRQNQIDTSLLVVNNQTNCEGFPDPQSLINA